MTKTFKNPSVHVGKTLVEIKRDYDSFTDFIDEKTSEKYSNLNYTHWSNYT